MSYVKVLVGVAVCAAVIVVADSAVGQQAFTKGKTSDSPYTVERIPVPSGFAFGEIVDINRFGEAVGSAGGPEGTRPMIHARGEVHVLEDLGGLNNYLVAVNDTGQIAGSSQAHPWWGSRAVRWDRDGTMHVMMPLTGDEHDNCWAAGMNNRGDIVGQSEVSNGMARAFYWSADGISIDLGTFGGPYSQARDVNDHGVVVGWADSSGEGSRAFVWREGQMSALESSRGIAAGSRATAINNEGVIVGGVAGDVWGETHAVIWDVDGSPREIEDLGDIASIANDINDRGAVVGELDGGAGRRAFLYESGVLRDLNDFVPAGTDWVFERAHAISADGRIVVTGRADGEHASFLLEPRVARATELGEG